MRNRKSIYTYVTYLKSHKNEFSVAAKLGIFTKLYIRASDILYMIAFAYVHMYILFTMYILCISAIIQFHAISIS